LDNVGREVADADRKHASSGSTGAGKAGNTHVRKETVGGDDPDESGDDPDMELPAVGRKPRAQRRKVQDAAVGPPAEDDWRGFNIGRVVRLLRTTNEAVLRLQLRKLHVRWWHSSTLAMTRLLQRVGVSDTALGLIRDIVDSCPVCRQWVRPSPHNQVGINLPDTFNDQVEMDLLFHAKHVIFHMVDRCTRWHAAAIVPNRESETLVAAIDRIWVSIHGPPRELICDGETAIAKSAIPSEYCRRKGIRLHIRPPGQHAPYVERRGDVLRQTFVRLLEQRKQQSLDIPPEQILAEAVFCGNALTTVNDNSPYNAVYRRTPRTLPSADQIERPDENEQPLPGLIRDTFKLRELAVQAMVQGSAQARLNKSMHTKSTITAEALDLRLGENVDFHRPPTSKDVSGWYGPAEVVNMNDVHRGTVTEKLNNRLYEVELRSV